MDSARGLDLVHKGVMMHLGLSADSDGRFFGTVAGLARTLGLTRGEARWSLAILNRLGLITLEQPKSNQSTTTTTHLLTVNYCIATTKEQPHNNHEKIETIGEPPESGAVKKEEKVTKENKEYKDSISAHQYSRDARDVHDDSPLYAPSVFFPHPTTAKEVMDQAEMQCVPMSEDEAQDFLDYYTGLGWAIGNSPIRKWPVFLKGWHSRWNERKRRNEIPKNDARRGNGPAHFSGDYSRERDEAWKCCYDADPNA